GPRWIVRAIFKETDRCQSAGLGRRNGADGGIRGLWSVRAQGVGLTRCRRAVSAQRHHVVQQVAAADARQRRARLSSFVLGQNTREETLAREPGGPGGGAHAVARDAGGGVGGAEEGRELTPEVRQIRSNEGLKLRAV